ncbi:MAG TPA: hypothetical protein VMJ32_04185 [Pirellulales bacterium]|nr:hypothetical protein [Pirellulales bacterium]
MSHEEYSGVWSDGPYLIAHSRMAQFPPKCIICGDEKPCRQLSCKVRKRPRIWWLLIWWWGVFSASVVIKPYFCDKHRQAELLLRWLGRVMVSVASALIVVPIILAVNQRNFRALPLVSIGTLLLCAWVYYRIFRRKLLYAAQIVRSDAWIEDVHPSVLKCVPVLQEDSTE